MQWTKTPSSDQPVQMLPNSFSVLLTSKGCLGGGIKLEPQHHSCKIVLQMWWGDKLKGQCSCQVGEFHNHFLAGILQCVVRVRQLNLSCKPLCRSNKCQQKLRKMDASIDEVVVGKSNFHWSPFFALREFLYSNFVF